MHNADSSEAARAGAAIAHLQQSVQFWMDADRVLPADGSSLLATLDRALKGLAGEDTRVVRAEIQRFTRRVQALIAARALEVGDGQPLIEAAAVLVARLPSAGSTHR